MAGTFLDTPVEYLKGVGPQRAEMLKKELGITTFGELVSLFPFRYVDRSQFHRISEISDEHPWVQLRAVITRVTEAGAPRAKRVIATVEDESGEIDLVWFQGQKWIMDKLKPGTRYIIFGKPSLFNGRWNIAHPELELPQETPLPIKETLRPLYNSTEKLKSKGLDSRGIAKLIKTLILNEKFHVPENLSDELLNSLKLMPRKDAFIHIHFPESNDLLKRAQARLKFEELFYIQVNLIRFKNNRNRKIKGFVFSTVGDNFNNFYFNNLPFKLTEAQKKVNKIVKLPSGYYLNWAGDFENQQRAVNRLAQVVPISIIIIFIIVIYSIKSFFNFR